MLTRKPRKGDKIRWPDWPAGKLGTVTREDDIHPEILHIDVKGRPDSFIWTFKDGMNQQAEIVEAQS